MKRNIDLKANWRVEPSKRATHSFASLWTISCVGKNASLLSIDADIALSLE